MRDIGKNPIVHEVNFEGGIIQVVEENGRFYVAMKPVCENMGLNWRAQHELITRDPVLGSDMRFTRMIAADGKLREMLTLPLEYINDWLFKIKTARYKGRLRSRLISYQERCHLVLFERFHAPPSPFLSMLHEIQSPSPELFDGIGERLSAIERRLGESEKARAVPQNPFAGLVGEYCSFGAEYMTGKNELHDAYPTYCMSEDIPHPHKNFFFRKLYELDKRVRPATRRLEGKPVPCVRGIAISV